MAPAAGALTVLVAGEALALPAGAVREVLRPRPLTRVPHAPPALLGLAALRGGALPVVSLAALTGRAAVPPSPAARILVLDGPTPAGLLVDGIAGSGGGAERVIDPTALLAAAFGAPAPRRSLAPAIGPAAPDAAAATLALLGFALAGQEFALPLDKVVAVLRQPAAVTRTGAAAGVTSYRGGLLLPLLAPHGLLGLPAAAEAGRVVVVRLGPALVGLLVDRITAIHRLPESAIDPVPAVLARGGEARLEAIGRLADGRLAGILAPARLFDAETTAGLLAGAGREAEAMAESGTAPEAVERVLVFRLGGEEYGLPLAAVEEVARRPARLTRLPRAPAFVAGAMNLRGTVLPVIDQRRRFAAGGEAPVQGGRVIVVTTGGVRAGFGVDAVVGILALPAAALAPAPEIAGGGAVFDRVATVEREGRMILLIDPQALLDAAERDLIDALARTGDAAAP